MFSITALFNYLFGKEDSWDKLHLNERSYIIKLYDYWSKNPNITLDMLVNNYSQNPNITNYK